MLRLSYLAARDRATGEISILALAGGIAAGTAASDVAEVAELYRHAVGPDGASEREKYSHLLLVIENEVRHHHDFADPKIAELAALKEQLRVARDAHASAILAEDQAKALASDAQASAKSRKAAADKVAKLEERLASLDPKPAPEPTKEPEKKPATMADELAALDDEHLRQVADKFKVEWKQGDPREPVVAAILVAAGYKAA